MLVLYSILLVGLFLAAAIVIDLAALRQDRRGSQTIADFSATAGALALDPVFGGTPLQACHAARAYFVSNSGVTPSGGSDPCSVFATMGACDATTPAISATELAGPYTLTITIPVPNPPNDLGLLDGRFEADIDGAACERVAVKIQRTRGYVFGGVIGASSGSSLAQAVARTSARQSQGDAVSLVLLDPTGCKSLWNKGQAKVLVRGKGGLPGIITLDSSGTQTTGQDQLRKCTQQGQDFTVDAFNSVNTRIEAAPGADAAGNPISGVIYSYALIPGQGTPYAFDTDDVIGSPVRLVPRPVPGNRVGRIPIDWRYNCKPSNGCPFAASTPPHIDNVRAALGTAGSPPPGFNQWTAVFGQSACSTQPGDPQIVVQGNWWIDCAKLTVRSWITFQTGSVVFEGPVDVQGGGLCINMGTNDCAPRATTADSCPSTGAATDAIVYVRSGAIVKRAQACLTLNQNMVYIEDGHIDFGAGDGALTWTAPLAGDFQNLGLWSESSAEHMLGGQAALTLEGAFFTPNAYPFVIQGQGFQFQTKAQFITFRLHIDGLGVLEMEADPERIIPIPLQGVRLIR